MIRSSGPIGNPDHLYSSSSLQYPLGQVSVQAGVVVFGQFPSVNVRVAGVSRSPLQTKYVPPPCHGDGHAPATPPPNVCERKSNRTRLVALVKDHFLSLTGKESMVDPERSITVI